MNTLRTVIDGSASGCTMSYRFDTLRSGSAMTGKFSAWPWVSSMSFAHLPWLSAGSTDRPIGFTCRLSHSPFSRATSASSVVQTGVKSFGWLNSTPHEPPSQSWNLMRPWVVSCSKSGAIWPS